MRIELQRVTITPMTVEIPDNCPACGASVANMETDLRAVACGWLNHRITLIPVRGADADVVMPTTEQSDYDGDDAATTEIICECGQMLATTEPTAKAVVDGDGGSIDDLFPGLTSMIYPPKGDK